MWCSSPEVCERKGDGADCHRGPHRQVAAKGGQQKTPEQDLLPEGRAQHLGQSVEEKCHLVGAPTTPTAAASMEIRYQVILQNTTKHPAQI